MSATSSRFTPTALFLLALVATPPRAQQPAPAAASTSAQAPAAAAASAFEAELKQLATRWRSARREYDRALRRGEDASKLVDMTPEYIAKARELARRAAGDPAAADAWMFALDLAKGDAPGELYAECLAALGAGSIEDRLARLCAEEWRATLGSAVAEARMAALAQRKLDVPRATAVRFALATSLLRAEQAAGAKPAAFAAPAESTPERIASARKLLEEIRSAAKDSDLGRRADDLLFSFEHLAIGTVAEDFTTVDENGKEWKLSDYRGKVVVVDFWGFW